MDVHNLIEILIDWEANIDKRKSKHTRKTKDKTPSGVTDVTPKKSNNKLRMGLSWTVSVPRNVLSQSRKRKNENPLAPSDRILSGKDIVQYKRVEGVGFDSDFY